MDKKSQESLKEQIKFFANLQKAMPFNTQNGTFQATKRLEADTKKAINEQKTEHREKLLQFIMRMSGWSLLALCVFIGGGAIYRTIRPDVQLISDTVIQYFIVGVFAEIFGVVAIIAKQVWSE